MGNEVMTGEYIGHYRLLRIAGKGGMGVVYEAWDTTLDRRVALKLLHPHLLSDPVRQRGFTSEARNAARIEHPNVVRIYRIEEIDGQTVIEMQYIHGQSLSALLHNSPFTACQALDVTRQVLGALACCHAQGLIHCDLKPSNLLVTLDGRVHLTDFGIARALSIPDETPSQPATTETLSGPLWGTPRYSPPEALEGETPTAFWDLYAAGVLLHEMLLGKPLFHASTPLALIKQILTQDVPSLAESAPGLPEPLCALAASLIARDPAERPASAQAALEQVDALCNSTQNEEETLKWVVQRDAARMPALVTPSAHPLPTATLLQQINRRWKWSAAGVFLLGVAIVLFVARTAMVPVPPGPIPQDKPAPFQGHQTISGDVVFFPASDRNHGCEPAWYCPSNRETQKPVILDVVPGSQSSNPRRFMARADGEIFFTASTPETGEELWFCSDTGHHEFKARIVKDIIPGSMGSEPEPILVHENLLFFWATTIQHGREVWCTNGNDAQTAMVADLFSGPQGSYPYGSSTAADRQGFYWVGLADGLRGKALFRYDFATASIHEVADVSEDCSSLIVFKDRLFFGQTDDAHGSELWVYDPEKTQPGPFADLQPGTAGSSPSQFFVWKDRLYFQARTRVSGSELWVTDGTPDGTVFLKDINPGTADGDPYGFVDGGSCFFFRAKDAPHGQEPWVSDGTPEGTQVLADVWPGPKGSVPYNMTAQKDLLFFSATDETHGEELFAATHDGTEWRSALLVDLMPGPENSAPHDMRWTTPSIATMVAQLPGHGECLVALEKTPDGLARTKVIPVLDLWKP